MERIEKLEGSYDVPQLKQKLNEIIDYLNTQPQAGEYPQKAKYISGEVPEEKKTLVQLRRVFDKKRVKEWDRIAMETYKQATQSTPEQKEEWEKKWEEFFLYVTNNKNWVDGRPEWKGNVYITLYNAMKDFIKDLLLERERWAIDTFLKDTASYNSFHNGRPRTMRNGLSGEGFEVRVSKLTTK